ncbi:DUF6766 family protein [Thermoactinospora rubra]|uniref:DUF6766 family protein n=1 Tax=Thermoactinospora rubra TaxID=1088767 RepID=UPI000A11E10B|nr:DUF6766 family protein [Thermoactinospora rubra]
MKIRENALSLVFLALFFMALVGQAFAGWASFNERQVVEGGSAVSVAQYVASSEFAVDVAENWQSEYLQFLLFVIVTVWVIQKGSTESKEPGKEGAESDKDQKIGPYAREDSPAWAKAGGFRRWLFSNSLGLVMGIVFALSWLAQSVAGLAAYNADRLSQLRDTTTWGSYVLSADFWNRTLQNWQSEFLAVASMVVFSIYLRQRGSPESKPVGTSHESTGVSG